MDLPNPWQADEAVLRLIVEGMRAAGGEPIVFQYLVHSRARYEDPLDTALAELSPSYVHYEEPLELSSRVWANAWGFERADPGNPEVQLGFIPALRELVDFFVRHKPDSPTRAERVVVDASQLALSAQLSPSQLRIVGHLLAVEQIGAVEWREDPLVPWEIELALPIMWYRRVFNFDDFLRVKLGRSSS